MRTLWQITQSPWYGDKCSLHVALHLSFISIFRGRSIGTYSLMNRDMSIFCPLSTLAKRSCTVEMAKPWKTFTVQRNLPTLKFFHDFSCGKLSLKLLISVAFLILFSLYLRSFSCHIGEVKYQLIRNYICHE